MGISARNVDMDRGKVNIKSIQNDYIQFQWVNEVRDYLGLRYTSPVNRFTKTLDYVRA